MNQNGYSEGFKEYLEAEINVMMSDIGPDVKPGSTRFAFRALKWIEQNAADFRMKWDKERNTVISDAVNDRKAAR
jgi:hypothetical protein